MICDSIITKNLELCAAKLKFLIIRVMCSTYDVRSHVFRVVVYRGEPCVVDKVSLIENGNADKEAQHICITIRSQVIKYDSY